MTSCIIFGGSGYIGTKLTEHFLNANRFDTIYVCDIKRNIPQNTNVIYFDTDVRKPIDIPIRIGSIEWIFNFAAIHREPGHSPKEYYETNILGAQNVCDFASKVQCLNIFFTASISVYGPTLKPTDEYALTMPNTPYGISKLTAEYLHQVWAHKTTDRRLVSVRPGVIYGPGDPGNILRMINAIKKGYFFLPVNPVIKKSYGYVYGLIDSINFMMTQKDKIIIYNYVEQDTESLKEMIKIINKTLNYNGKIIRIPYFVLQIGAYFIYKINPNFNGIHPERVKKVARPTHIVPKILIDMGFTFKYDFKKSLIHWKSISRADLK